MSKILIIEQDTFFGDVLNQKITEQGYETLVTNNGAIGLEQMHLFNPDLVILDMELTNANPFDLLKNKNRDSTLSHIPVIIISASGDLAEIKKVVDLGVKDYLVKAQLNLADLGVKIKAHVSKEKNDAANKITLSGKKVMWVEDDQFLSDLISRKLTAQGSKLLYARTGEDALTLLQNESPDIILLDILLPGISGFDVLERIKSNEKTKNIPIIILSNFSQNNEIERSIKLGADKFLVKASIVLDDLVREMSALLESKKI